MQEILDAIQGLEQKLDSRLDGLEERIRKLEQKDGTRGEQVSDIYEILKRMIDSGNGVIKRDQGRCALDKDEVYSRFARRGIDRRSALRRLRAEERIVCDSHNKNTRPVLKARRLIRAVVAYINQF